MAALLRFYPGLTRADFWAMPGDERRALTDHMARALQQQG